jgi:hypothetical protein
MCPAGGGGHATAKGKLTTLYWDNQVNPRDEMITTTATVKQAR